MPAPASRSSSRTVALPKPAWISAQTRVDGARVHYVEVGRGEPVLLLHGYPQSHLCWRHQIDALAARYRVIAPDWLGFGQSERSLQLVPSYAAESERIGRFAAAIGLSRFNLVCHDYGGYLSWMDEKLGRRWYFHFFAHYHVPVRPELAAGLSQIRCPSAVIWGDRDPYIPFATAEELARRMPRATLTRIRGADHYVMEERPQEVTEAMERLLETPLEAERGLRQ